MLDGTRQSEQGEGLSRRRFLRRTGAGAAGVIGAAALASGPAAAQAQINKHMLIDTVEEFSGNYGGQFLTISDPKQKRVDRAAFDDCGLADWNPEDTKVYDAVIVDRFQRESPRTASTDVYMNADEVSNVGPGTMFIINRVSDCPDPYKGLVVGQFEATNVRNVGVGDTERTHQTGTSGPGFGVAATLAGVGVSAAALGWRALGGEDS